MRLCLNPILKSKDFPVACSPIAEMVAAQRFNEAQGQPIATIYGSISNGNQWQFLKLEGTTLVIDLAVYPLPPVEGILGDLVWMAQAH